MTHCMTTRILVFITLISVTLFAGCANFPANQASDRPSQTVEQPKNNVLDLIDLTPATTETNDFSSQNTQEYLLDLVRQAKSSKSPRQEALLLKATHTAVKQNEVATATRIYQLISPDSLTTTADLDYYYALIGLELAIAHNNINLIQQQYEKLESIASQRRIPLATAHFVEDSQIRAKALSLLGEHLNAAQLLVSRIDGVKIDPQLQLDIHNQIWSYLSKYRQNKQSLRADSEKDLSLDISFPKPQGEQWQAWFELSDIFDASDKGQFADMQMQLQSWQKTWTNAAVVQLPPDSVQEFIMYDFKEASQVAVLLPTSGKLRHAGKAIIDGIMASYYHENAQTQKNLNLKFYDSASGESIENIYQRAVNEGAEFVIGPLEKENVQALKSSLRQVTGTNQAIPTLALNYTNNDQPNQLDTLMEFGLSAEDEARAVAEYAINQGYDRALILRPDSDWGERISAAFAEQFKKENGKILDETAFTKPRQFSKEVQNLLGLEVSRARHKEMERELGEKLDYTPRRRQDVDFIFMLASPNEARQLKPTINYHYGQDIPVLATSHLYSGTPQPAYDKDLDGIIFADIPWILDQDVELKQTFEEQMPQAQTQFKRLHALGIDAFRLMREYPVLKHLSSSQLSGTTGQLSVNADGQVHRDLSWARFRNGKAVAIETGN